MSHQTALRNMAIQRTSLHLFLTPERGRFITPRIATNQCGITSGMVRAAQHLLEQDEPRADRLPQWGVGTPHNPERM
jgi:hypothetical protein